MLQLMYEKINKIFYLLALIGLSEIKCTYNIDIN